jgi:hypothetical protein
MQIKVVDDCSDKDDPEELVNEIGRGRVLFHQKPISEGAVPNFHEAARESVCAIKRREELQ